MTYAVSSALQTAVYQQLVGDAALTALVGSDIYDALPPGTPPNTYVSLGPEDVQDASDTCADGARHEMIISVVTDTSGFQSAKDVAAAICDALIDTNMTLTPGRVLVRQGQGRTVKQWRIAAHRFGVSRPCSRHLIFH